MLFSCVHMPNPADILAKMKEIYPECPESVYESRRKEYEGIRNHIDTIFNQRNLEKSRRHNLSVSRNKSKMFRDQATSIAVRDRSDEE